jgi:UDP-glucose 4-epimerase
MKTNCLNPYSVSKSAGEELCKMYYNLWGVETVSFRYFNVYGDRQPLKGQYAPVIGLFLRQKNNAEPMTVVGDGLQTRDFTNVEDVVNANILACKSDNKNILGEIINIGTGRSFSILDLVNIIKGDYKHIPARPAEARKTVADIRKAKNLLGWEPIIKLEDYLKKQ